MEEVLLRGDRVWVLLRVMVAGYPCWWPWVLVEMEASYGGGGWSGIVVDWGEEDFAELLDGILMVVNSGVLSG